MYQINYIQFTVGIGNAELHRLQLVTGLRELEGTTGPDRSDRAFPCITILLTKCVSLGMTAIFLTRCSHMALGQFMQKNIQLIWHATGSIPDTMNRNR
jgi:hypothetical protein